MRIDKIRAVAGPNIYTHKPVLVARLCLEELTDIASTEIPGFIDRLLAVLPVLREHRRSRGHPGGFVERLREGIGFAQVVWQVALEIESTPNQGTTVFARVPLTLPEEGVGEG